MKKQIATEEDAVKRARRDVDQAIQRRKDALLLEKVKGVPLASDQHKKAFFQASRQKRGSVGVTLTLSSLAGLSYINAMRTLKKVSKGTFGLLFRTEAVLTLVASVVSLLVVLIL